MWRLCKYIFLVTLVLVGAFALYVWIWEPTLPRRYLLYRETQAFITHAQQTLDTLEKQQRMRPPDLFTRDYAKDGLAPGQGVQTTGQPAAEKTCSYTRPNCTVTRAAIAAGNKDDYDTAYALIQAEDFEALARMILAGRATKLEPGTEVTLVSESPWTGRAQVRMRGDFTELWMARDALK